LINSTMAVNSKMTITMMTTSTTMSTTTSHGIILYPNSFLSFVIVSLIIIL
jgi:hypothetical protein